MYTVLAVVCVCVCVCVCVFFGGRDTYSVWLCDLASTVVSTKCPACVELQQASPSSTKVQRLLRRVVCQRFEISSLSQTSSEWALDEAGGRVAGTSTVGAISLKSVRIRSWNSLLVEHRTRDGKVASSKPRQERLENFLLQS